MDMEEEQCLHECESYFQSNNIKLLFKDCIVQLCLNKPDNPVTFLRQYFQKLERVSSTCFLRSFLSTKSRSQQRNDYVLISTAVVLLGVIHIMQIFDEVLIVAQIVLENFATREQAWRPLDTLD